MKPLHALAKAPPPKNSPIAIGRFVGEAQIRWILQTDKRAYGAWAKDQLAHLGPAFIKLGQFLSTRSDLLGKEVVSEISKLQDDISPVEFEGIIHVIEHTLGKPWKDVFMYIDEKSLASASIGQVHKAKLKTGEDVVIKVQKPHVAMQINNDLQTLKNMNEWLAKTGSARSVEFDHILTEYSRFLSSELDFTMEAQHMIRFAEMMDGLPVRVPHVYTHLSNKNMIVMEYIPSTKITDIETMRAKSMDTSKLAQTLIQLFMHQMVYSGYVHCDPHPGNIGVLDDGETIVLYDFGNVVELSVSFRKELNNLVYSIVTKDVDEFVELLQKLQILEIRDALETIEVKEFFRSFFAYLEDLDFNALRSSVIERDMQGNSQVKLRIDPDFLSLFRVFSLLDGTCAKLDPKFNYIEALRPYTDEMMKDLRFWDVRVKKDFEKLRSYPSYIRNTDNNILRVQKKMHMMNESFTQFQWIMMLWVWIDHPNDWIPWVVSLSIVGWVQIQKDRAK